MDSLRAWKVQTSLPRTFKSDVWRKIAARQKQPAFVSAFAEWLLALMARPVPALTCAALVLAIGGGSGYLSGRGHKGHTESELLAKYIQTIDPYQSLLARR